MPWAEAGEGSAALRLLGPDPGSKQCYLVTSDPEPVVAVYRAVALPCSAVSRSSSPPPHPAPRALLGAATPSAE